MRITICRPDSVAPTRRQFLAAAAAGLATLAARRAGLRPNHRPGDAGAGRLRSVDDGLYARAPAARAALAVSYHGRLVYARGFGHADLQKRQPVRPASLFRIASISKPFTATAVLQLVEQGKLKLDQRVLPLLKLEPHLERGARLDPRWHEIRIHHCLQHTAGWNRDKSFDPMSAETAEQVAKALKVRLPIHPKQIIRYMLGKPLDFAPGTAYAYSNFGYCVLGRVIEAVGRLPYHKFVAEKILAPLKIREMRLGKNLLKDRTRAKSGTTTAETDGPGHFRAGDRQAGVAALRRRVHRDDERQRRLDRLGGGPGPFRRGLRQPAKLPPAEGRDHPHDARAAARAGGPRTGGQAQGGLLWLWLGRPAGRAAIRPLHQVAHGRAGGDLYPPGLPRRPHRLGRAVQHRRRSARKGAANIIDPLLHKPADEIELARHRPVSALLTRPLSPWVGRPR